MEIKVIPGIYVYYQTVKTNLNDIGKYVGSLPMELIQKASQEGYKITGPQFWNYRGMDGNPDTTFQLDVCIPVEELSTNTSENTGIIEGFRCASMRIKGPWSNLQGAYEKLIAEMASENLSPGVYCREVYHEVDFEHPENCLTEIQLGIN